MGYGVFRFVFRTFGALIRFALIHNKMKALKIGNLLAPVPIVQGGMGVGISLAGLASAVADQGGIGVISSAGLG